MSALRAAAFMAMALTLAACGNADTGRLQGWVEGDFVFVGPDDAGRVEALAVREGDQVTAGVPLFAVDADLQQSDVNTSAAQVAEARARLARLEAAQQRTEEVAVLEAQERRAEAMLMLSTAELERQQTLTAKGVGTQAALDTAKSNFNRDTAALDQVRRQITVARLSAREEDIAAARQTLAAAEARRNSAETKLARRRLAAPVGGAVQQVYYRPGEMVPAGRPVVSILPPGNIKVRFFVGEPVLPTVKLGDAVEVTCDGCAAPVSAKVSFIARSAEYTPPVIYSLEERNKLVFMIEARPDTADGLRVGQPVSVALKK
ncbi:MAG: HlyD family efflux transporter periplasmic adaptor subunit [Alphaproteobacteria bacterium]|nr:MAG: HlyD family efflux transporter periplasmic adaptor subunit [Alphaproteobacteria bacterium]